MSNEEIVTESQSEETKESVSARKRLLIFWSRMAGWFLTGVGIPITVFSIKFGLFTKYGYEVTTDELGNITGSRVAINGWGIVSIILIGIFALSIINEILKAYENKYSFTKQCLDGLRKRIIPLALVIGICYWLRGVLDQVIFCLFIIGVAQLAAIPLNPLPEWRNRKLKQEDYSDCLTELVRIFKKRLSKKGDK